ncbi:MAG: sodium/solute symporter [bacterium]
MLNWLDIGVVVAFYLLVVGVSLYKGRRGTSSEDYFLAGRGLPWPLIGLSIVAANISTEQFVGMAGQAAGSVGLAVSAWQLTGSVGIVIVAFTLLPRFLRAGIYTMPEYLEYRYNPLARTIMALFTMIIYVTVTMTAVLYSGGLTLATIFGIPLGTGVLALGFIAALLATGGGLKSVAWADFFLGTALLLGGGLTLFLGLRAVGGIDAFMAHNADRMHIVLPASHPLLPWTGVVLGMWIPILYYTGLNQDIAQRSLAARSLGQGQLGIVFAAALWLLVPFVIVVPGMISHQLYGAELATPDAAYPTLIRRLVPIGLRGVMLASIAGAVIGALASLLNSTATIFTMDLYKRTVRPTASPERLVAIGRLATVVFVVIACTLAPMLASPRFQGVFNFIQEFQGYISPGIVAAFLIGILVPRAPAAAGVTALLGSAPVYGMLQWQLSGVHFLIRMLITFVVVAVAMLLITVMRPLAAPRTMPVQADLDLHSSTLAKWLGAGVVVAVVTFFAVFW